MDTSESGVQFCSSLCHAMLSGIALRTKSQNWTSGGAHGLLTSESAVLAPVE